MVLLLKPLPTPIVAVARPVAARVTETSLKLPAERVSPSLRRRYAQLREATGGR